MFTPTITNESTIAGIVKSDYRAADVFARYNINYCCAGNVTLEDACQAAGLDPEELKKELRRRSRVIEISPSLDFHNWKTDFLIDYIIHIHHAYLAGNLPGIRKVVEKFALGHQSRYPYLAELMKAFEKLCMEIIPHLDEEEKVIFPYIRQLAHAFDDREPYAVLLVRTLRKSLDKTILHEQENIAKYLIEFRRLTNDYNPPRDACLTHRVALAKLKELDQDLNQHLYLENEILFTRALSIEQQLIQNGI